MEGERANPNESVEWQAPTTEDDSEPEISLREQRREEVREAFQDRQNAVGKKKWLQYWREKLMNEEDLPQDMADIMETGDSLDGNAAFANFVNGRVQSAKYFLAKQEQMKRLYEELSRIDRREPLSASEELKRRTLSYDEESGRLFVTLPNGKEREMTLGTIMADATWGIRYNPDDSIPERLWRRIRKMSAIHEARSGVTDVFNRELADREGVSLPTTSMSAEFVEEHPQSGVVAERLAQSLITEWQYDRPELGVKYEESNAIEDAVLKYDFKMTFTDRRRGVAMADEDGDRKKYVGEKQRLGVQFTVNNSPDTLAHKARQIDRAKRDKDREKFDDMVSHQVDDIVLVSVKMTSIQNAFRSWLRDGKPSGGPLGYLSQEDRHKLVRAITDKIPGFDEKLVEELAA